MLEWRVEMNDCLHAAMVTSDESQIAVPPLYCDATQQMVGPTVGAILWSEEQQPLTVGECFHNPSSMRTREHVIVVGFTTTKVEIPQDEIDRLIGADVVQFVMDFFQRESRGEIHCSHVSLAKCPIANELG